MDAGKSVSKIGKIGSRIKGKIVNTVENVEREIYEWHHKGKKQSDSTNISENTDCQIMSIGQSGTTDAPHGTEEPGMLSTTPSPSQSSQPIPSSGESSLILRDNSNVQLNVVLPSGKPADAPSFGAESRGANPGGKFVLEGNKDMQLCLTSAAAGTPSSSTSGGETIITGNSKTQVYSASGVTAGGAGGDNQASVKLSDNSDSQIMNLAHSANLSSTNIEKNSGCQIMNVPVPGHSASTKLNEIASSPIVPRQTTLDEPQPVSTSKVISEHGATIALNYDFLDVALTKEDTVLLAISGRGLTEYSLNREELHHWRPTKPRTNEPEEVVAVATMTDGRVAAGLCYSQLVVVLRRTGRRNITGDGWTEDMRLPKLQSPPWRISLHADMLAVALGRFDKVVSSWRQGRQVQLLRLSDKAPVNRLSLLYDVHSLAITDDLVITVSYGKVSTRSGRGVHVVDAQKVADATELLWRYDAVTDDEEIQEVCAASDAGLLYALVRSSNLSCGRIVIISLRDGSELLSNALGFRIPLLPVCLSLGDNAIKESCSITTVLCRDLKSSEWRTVTVQNRSVRSLECHPQ